MSTIAEVWSEFEQFRQASGQTADYLGLRASFFDWFRRTYPALGDPDFWFSPPEFSLPPQTTEPPFSGHLPGNLNPHPGPPGPLIPYVPNPSVPVSGVPSQPRLPSGPGAFVYPREPETTIHITCAQAKKLSRFKRQSLLNQLDEKGSLSPSELELYTCVWESLNDLQNPYE